MAKKKDIIREIPDSEIELFGAHKTKEQIKADEKVRKAKERAALKEEIAARRKEGKSGHPALREMLPVFIVCGIIVVLCVVLLVIQFSRAEESNAWQRNESIDGWFTDVEVAPNLTDEGITANVVEAYYTNNGHLMLRMILGNGSEEALKLDSLVIDLWNGDDEYIGGGKITVSNEVIMVPANDSTNYTCYISPEHLSIKNDPLSTLRYDISITGSSVAEDDDSTTD